MINVQIEIPEALLPFANPKDEREQLLRNAMIIFPFIQDETISYQSRAAKAPCFSCGDEAAQIFL